MHQSSGFRKLGLTALVMAATFMQAHAQYWTPVPGNTPVIESSTNEQRGLYPYAYPGGKLLVNTNYAIVNGGYNDGLWVRLNSDGSTDTTYSQPAYSSVILVYPDGRSLIWQAADPGSYNGNIKRLLATGAVDPSFTSLSINNSSVNAELLPDERIFLFGHFTVVGGVRQVEAALVGPTGALDGAFQSPFNSNLYTPTINTAKVTADGQHLIIAGGGLGLGAGLQYIARLNLDGSVDATFNAAGAGFSENLYRVYPDAAGGGVLVAGVSSSIKHLTSTGSVDSGFTPALVGTNPVFGPQQTDGKIFYLVYTYVGQTYSRQLRRMNADGSDDATFPAISTPQASTYEIGLPVLSDDGTLLIGPMTAERKAAQIGFTRVLANGTIDAGYNPRFSDYARIGAHALLPDGKLLLAGFIGYVNGTPVPQPNEGMVLVRLNADGSLDTGFSATLPSVPYNGVAVERIVIQPSGKILLGGAFPGAVIGIIRLENTGTVDSTFTPISMAGSLVFALDGMGRIYAMQYNEYPVRVVRYSADGVLDPAFQAPALGYMNEIVPMLDGSVLVCSTVGPSGQLTRLLGTGAIDPSFVRPELPSIVSMALLPDGNVMVCQEPASINYGGVYEVISRLQPNGVVNVVYSSRSTPQSGGPKDPIRLAMAGVLFDLLRSASPGTAATLAANFSRSEHRMELTCRTDGHLLLRSTSQYDPRFQVFQRSTLTSPSVDPAPFLYEAPISSGTTFPVNADFNVTVTAVGGLAGNITYQWQKDGQPVAGQTNRNLNLSRVQPADAGNYTLVINNGYGSMSSPAIPLTVDPTHVLAGITTQPVSQTAVRGRTAVLSVLAVGDGPLAYQWYHDGVPIPGATGSALTLNGVQPGDAGNYSVWITNFVQIPGVGGFFGSVTSNVAALTISLVDIAPSDAIITITVE